MPLLAAKIWLTPLAIGRCYSSLPLVAATARCQNLVDATGQILAASGGRFLIIGASCIGDIYRLTEHATAMGWFLSGALLDSAVGPSIGGALVGAYFLLLEITHRMKSDGLTGLPLRKKASSSRR